MGKREVVSDEPRYIKLNARDNVAIVVNDFGLPAGTRFPCGLELRAFVPQGHKTALDDIEEAFDLFSHQRDGVLKVALHPGPRPETLDPVSVGARVGQKQY